MKYPMAKARGFYASIALGVGLFQPVGLHKETPDMFYSTQELGVETPRTYPIVKVPYHPRAVATCSIG